MRRVCDVLSVARSSFYYRPVAADETALEAALEALAAQWPTYGYRRLTAELMRAGWAVNHKRVARLMRSLGLSLKPQRRKKQTTNSRHDGPRFPNLLLGLDVVRPDQVWVADITYIRLRRGFVYLAVLMDIFTRAVRGWELSRGLDSTLTLAALERALARGQPKIHHSDQGLQYVATAYLDQLAQVEAEVSMAAVGAAWQNGHAERLIRTIKEEAVALHDYRDFADAYARLGCFLEDVYQHKRIHSSLGYLTPVEFETQWRQEQALMTVID